MPVQKSPPGEPKALHSAWHYEDKYFNTYMGCRTQVNVQIVKLIAEHFLWPNLNADIYEWVSTCLKCQPHKVHRHTKSSIGTFNNRMKVKAVLCQDAKP